ncbi:transporter [Gordonia sp. TBRC 11910]|uniref:Transporter n=1 Tax=Gordonia asplenii TaxID=2725283 RepID=A0A848KQX2_9ACTN|nr:transporter [Gordonia asplenii]NMO00642.1 transporter [Gordonia asplenii]
MSIKELLFVAADVWMIAVGFTYGIKFIRNYKNWLLGLEWMIIATSGTNFLVFSVLKAGYDSPMYTLAYFLDAFSRSIGITLILVLGLMKVTHRYKPSLTVEIGAFALAAVFGYVLAEYAEQLGAPGKIFYIVVNVATTLFLIYFAKRLWEINERAHAIWVGIATALGFVIASMYDFVHIPGDDEAHTIFYILALATWGLQLFAYYRAYRAFDADNQRVDAEESHKNVLAGA